MPSSYTSSQRSRMSTSSTNSSQFSHQSANTYSTNITNYSDARPTAKHFDTCPDRLGLFLEKPLSLDDDEGIDPRSSVETYASTVASDADLEDIPEYDLPHDRHSLYETDAIPTTAPDFAKLFPTTRRLLIQHDDSTSDGNMNLRVDTEAASPDGERLKMTLFHLRMQNLHERQFSLRRYCRDSGREICNSKKKYAKPTPKSLQRKRPTMPRSVTTALHNIGIKKVPSREDSGYESDDAEDLEEELRKFTFNSEIKATIPTNTIRLEFSNYAQVEVHRRRQHNVKKYDFEYWGAPYCWRREVSYDDDELVCSYELINMETGKCVAYIMPDKLDGRQSHQENAQGGWVPPSSLRITEKTVSQDLGDVIVATGLIALTDECIKRRWHNSLFNRIHIPTKSSHDYVHPHKVADEVFRRNPLSNTRR